MTGSREDPMKNAFLTIDDGPTDDFNRKVDYLESQELPAIFFCTGLNLERRPSDAVRAIRKGYVIGSHSHSHRTFSKLPLEACFEEIERTDAIIERLYEKAAATPPAKLFRFPGGDKGVSEDTGYFERMKPRTEVGRHRKDALQNFLREKGYAQPRFGAITYEYFTYYGLLDDADCFWTYDSCDYAPVALPHEFGITSLEKVLSRMDEDVPEGERGLNYPSSDDIILMHDMEGIERFFVPMIEKLLTKGLSFALPEWHT